MSVPAQAITIGQHLPWVNSTMDYTDRLVSLIPDELLDYRPVDPNGHFFFSLAEVAMHLADERLEFARMLDGSDHRDKFWMISNWETGGDGTPWEFVERGSKEQLLAALRDGREELAPWLSLPLERLQEPTEGTRRKHEQLLSEFKAKGTATKDFELRGPSTINRVLFALIVHECGHRAYLQTILRLQGVDARGEY